MTGRALIHGARSFARDRTPRLPRDHLERPGIRSALDRPAAVTIVRGPLGSGKTSLVSEWLRTDAPAHHCAMWVKLDKGCTRDHFWRTIRTAVTASTASADTIDQTIRHVARMLNDLPGESTLVIDAFERVSEAGVTDDLDHLLYHCPRLRVIVLTRVLTDWETIGGSSNVDIEVIAWPQLAFTDAECALLLERHGIAYDHRALATLTDHLPGLTVQAVGSLRATLLPLDDLKRRLARSLGPRIQRTLRGHHRTLARFAVFPTVTEELAAVLAHPDDDAHLAIATVEEAGLGYWSHELGERRFAVLRPMRAALRDALPAAERAEVLRLGRDWFLEHGDGLTAFEAALEARDIAAAARIQLSEIRQIGDWPRERVIAALRRVPLDVLGQEPTLLVLLGWCMLNERPAIAPASFFLAWAARQIVDDPDSALAERLHTLTAKAVAERLGGNWEAAVQAAHLGMRLLRDAGPTDPAAHFVLPVAANQFGLSMLGSGDIDDAIEAFEFSWDSPPAPLAELPTDPRATDALTLLAASRVLRGEMTTAEELLTHLPHPLRWTGSRDLIIAPLYHLAQAEVHTERLRFDDAQTEIARVAHRLDRTEHWPSLMVAQARIDLGTGHPAASLASIEARLAGDAPPPSPHARIELEVQRALLLLCLGRVHDAALVLDGCPNTDARVVVVRGIEYLLTDRLLDAHTAVRRALRRPAAPRVRVPLVMVAVIALLRLERTAAAPLLDELSELLTTHGVRFPFALLPADDLARIRSALAVRDLPRARDAVAALAEVPCLIPPVTPPPGLSPRELVVLARLAQDESITKLAQALFVSPNTVKAQVRSIYRKLGVASREEALLAASERRLL